jgi:F-type H+-transporting ATPase subunit epsilon
MSLPSKLTLEIVAPDRPILREDVDEVEIPGETGYLGVLPGHTPLLAALKVGELWYRKGQEKFFLAVAFGFAEILPDRVTILARYAEKAEELDRERAEAAMKLAQARLEKPPPDIDYERTRIALAKAISRIQVASRIPAHHRLRHPQGTSPDVS